MYALLGQSRVIQNVGLIGLPERFHHPLLYLKCNVLTAPTEINLPYSNLPWQGGPLAHELWVVIDEKVGAFFENVQYHKPTNAG